MKFGAWPIGVVLPTLNVRSQLPGHLDQMRRWVERVEEIIVVDSYSTDGTLELLRDQLRHPRLQVFQSPPGLYQAWNSAISRNRAEFTYISTIGDAITPKGLEHLVDTASALGADVVISRPRFLDAAGQPVAEKRWPIDHLLDLLNSDRPRRVESALAFLVATLDVPEGILGSSASNLYRTETLRRFPFPTDYGHEADTAWGICHAFEISLTVTPRVFSEFIFNSGAGLITDERKGELVAHLLDLARETIRRELPRSPGSVPEPLMQLLKSLPDEIQSLRKCQRRYDQARRQRLPWLLNPAAWLARAKRNRQRRQVDSIKREFFRYYAWGI